MKGKSSGFNYDRLIPVFKVLLVLLIPLAVLFGVLSSMIFDADVYKEEFSKVGTYDRVPEADDMIEQIIGFFKGDVLNLNITEMTPGEATHLQDVKSLIWNFTLIFYFLVIAKLIMFGIIIFKSSKPSTDLIQITLGSGIITAGSPMMFSEMDFSFLFREFHLLFFPQGGWQFAESSLLIRLFPQEFFVNLSATIARQSIFVGGCLISFALVLYFVTRRE